MFEVVDMFGRVVEGHLFREDAEAAAEIRNMASDNNSYRVRYVYPYAD